MSSEIFPSSLPGIKLDVDRPVGYSTGIQEAASGKEYRALWFNRPRTRWRMDVEFLRSTSPDEWQDLVGFYQRHGGRFDSFLFQDPDDYTISASAPQVFGIGDGSTTAFQLQRTLNPLPNNLSTLFLSYTPGDSLDSLRAEFTRASVARYRDSVGILRSVVSGEVRTAAYPFGVGPCMLLEPAGTNLCIESQEFNLWTESGTCPVTANAYIAPDGTVTADLVSGGLIGVRDQAVTFTADGTKVWSIFMRQGQATANDLTIQDTTAGTARHTVRVTWVAAAPSLSTIAGSGTLFAVEAFANQWYRISFTADGVVAANTNVLRITPDAIAGTNGVYLWGSQAENATVPSSYIPTTTTSATRAADVLYVPTAVLPQSISMYAKTVNLGQFVSAAVTKYGLRFGSASTTADARFSLFSGSSGTRGALYDDGSTQVTSTTGSAVALGTTVEHRGVLTQTTWVVQVGSAVNGGAETTGTVSGSSASSSAWAAGRIYFSSTDCPMAYLNAVICQGTVSLADFRTLAGQVGGNPLLYPDFRGGYEPVVGLSTVPVISIDGTTKTAGNDYTYDSAGLVTFLTAPADGARIGWSGSYYKRVRFDSDAWATKRIVRGLWESRTLDLIEVV